MNTPDTQWSWALCPSGPEWKVNWSDIEEMPWFSDLFSCPQDEAHHAEGDVGTHTKLVVEALVRDPAWRSLDPFGRSIVFLSALMHDVAKPICTRRDSHGKLSAPEHTRLGAQMVRGLLWRSPEFIDSPPPLAAREMVSYMVRYSGLPLWILDKPDPAYSLIKASMNVRLDWLAMLSDADARGRECSDQTDLLERIELFREYARENECLHFAKKFPNDHSRFLFFHGKNHHPSRECFDDTRLSVHLMAGLPGAGKDLYLSEHLTDMPVISLDRLRQEMGIKSDEPQEKVVVKARVLAKEYLRKRQSFVWNATNITRFMRDRLVRFMFGYGAAIHMVYVEPVSFAELLIRNSQRQSPVPDAVLERLADKIEIPDPTEAHSIQYICM